MNLPEISTPPNEEIVLRLLRELHPQGRTIVMVTHDPVVARLADRRIELHHGKIAPRRCFRHGRRRTDSMKCWKSSGCWKSTAKSPNSSRMEVHGALPVSIAVEKMTGDGFGGHDAASAGTA